MSMLDFVQRPLSKQHDLDPGPHRTAIVLLASIAVFTALAVLWAAFSSLDISVHAQGRVVPSRKLQLVQSLEGGILRELAVMEGQVVKKGQLLARVENLEYNSELGESHQNDLGMRATLARMDAELGGKPPVFPDDVEKLAPDAVAREKQLWLTRRLEQSSSRETIQRQIEQHRQEVAETESKIASIRANLALAREGQDIEKKLFESGAGSRVDYIAAQQKVVSLQGDLSSAELSLPRFAAAVKEAQAKLTESDSRFRAETGLQRNETHTKDAALRELISGKSDRVARRELRSPMDGVVNRLLLSTEGGIAKPGESIMEVVPMEDTLLIAARVLPADIAFIRPGQTAKVRITAYDSSIYPPLKATVVRVGADAVLDEKQQPYFEVQLETEKNHVGSPEEKLLIHPGMLTDASIHTGKRTVLEYLFKPVVKTFRRALEER